MRGKGPGRPVDIAVRRPPVAVLSTLRRRAIDHRGDPGDGHRAHPQSHRADCVCAAEGRAARDCSKVRLPSRPIGTSAERMRRCTAVVNVGELRRTERLTGGGLQPLLAGPSHRETQIRRRKPAIRRYVDARFTSAPGRTACGRDRVFPMLAGSGPCRDKLSLRRSAYEHRRDCFFPAIL